jgi:hypothetical protein
MHPAHGASAPRFMRSSAEEGVLYLFSSQRRFVF